MGDRTPRDDAASRGRGTDGAREGVDARGPPVGGIDAFDSLVLRQPIREGRTDAALGLLGDWVEDDRGSDARALLPTGDVNLVTLFLDRAADGDWLRWHVEVLDDGADGWQAPDETVRRASRLFAAGLDDLLDPGATVHRDGTDGHQLVTHATHPRRQQRYDARCGRPLLAPVAGDDLPIAVAAVTAR